MRTVLFLSVGSKDYKIVLNGLPWLSQGDTVFLYDEEEASVQTAGYHLSDRRQHVELQASGSVEESQLFANGWSELL